MTTPDLLPDKWYSRELPVLRDVMSRIEAGDLQPHSKQIAASTGIDHDQVELSLRALNSSGLIGIMGYAGGTHVRTNEISGRAYQLVGLHPSQDVLAERFVAAVERMSAQSTDPATKVALASVLETFSSVGVAALGSAIGYVMSGQLP